MPSTNEFKLTCGDITSLSYLEGSIDVTDGEDFDSPPTFSHSGKTWTITLKADRKKSSGVADSFNRTVGGALHEYTNEGGDKQPKELNFYFGVRATFGIDGQSYQMDIYLGQGHTGLRNNWWFGANSLLNTGDPLYSVISGSVIRRTFRLSGKGSDEMTLSAI